MLLDDEGSLFERLLLDDDCDGLGGGVGSSSFVELVAFVVSSDDWLLVEGAVPLDGVLA